MDSSVCAVVVSYNSPALLTECINSAIGQVNKIVVADNSTDPAAIHAVRTFCAKEQNISLLFNEGNRGLGYALNQGLEYSLRNGYEWTLLLDQDSTLSRNMVREMCLSYESLPERDRKKAALVAPVVYEKNSKKEFPPLVFTSGFLSKRIKRPLKDTFIDFHISSGSLMNNRLISKVGFFKENLIIDYLDYDYCFRILALDLKILLSKNAILHHSLGKPGRKFGLIFKEHDSRRIYYQTRNRLLLLSMYGRQYRSFLFEQSVRLIGKFFKILLLESEKAAKIKFLLKGISDYKRYHSNL